MPVILHFPNNVNASGIDTSDATAKSNTILDGYSAYVQGQKITGNIKSKSAETYVPNTEDQEIVSGLYLEGNQTIKGDANLISENIKAGITIFEVSGHPNVIDTTETGNSASASNMEKGRIAYVNGVKITGNVDVLDVTEVIPTVEDQRLATNSVKKFIKNGLTVKGDVNLVAENIKAGVTIFGVTGTLQEGSDGTGAQVIVPVWESSETAADTFGSNLYFQADGVSIGSDIKDFSTILNIDGQFFSSSNNYALNYSMNIWGWGATVKTVCTTPVYLTPQSLIEYKVMSGDAVTKSLKFVSATGEGAELIENIYTNALVEDLYYDIGIDYFSSTNINTFIKKVPENLTPGYYYLYWETPTDNTQVKLHGMKVYTTEEA